MPICAILPSDALEGHQSVMILHIPRRFHAGKHRQVRGMPYGIYWKLGVRCHIFAL
jgi:hypothetical protein